MFKSNELTINIEAINVALSKVENANKIQLNTLKGYVSSEPEQAVLAFRSLNEVDSIDDKLKKILTELPHLSSEAQHLLETSILLQ
ncbi:hypothetical protein AB4455_07815 [Vibrio sp. 10N.261.46.E12]|uniref:hypothetical protein n=1 Tax=unclassified Vibrio TaxID=2614977 RepID=UPI0009759787|nr:MULTISPECIES: hypothetical protein [unclassified Vibrio]OMO36043.1 hypothetical protein BH584_05850 [Vibrio sp. 10N.261.45.E1]PMJ25596.1 hypothetical protein BCU27_10395 [Vibrio sp. 10N.286.45.B6]PML91469.1 hypothetical protein BCT66_04520 [Vibrio sp. 10N.261.49.E11]PMM66377.1 hypothetical protein BCT48_17435 [Vibrio sp. 10N.261.46.F12]PMM79361.1 hypothetical protein BCT46_20405 [Vibrio sp. 10N.261.46.E8]